MKLNDFDALVTKTSPALLAYLVRRVDPPHDAADVLSEVLITAYRKLSAIPDDANAARFWLFAVARRQLANYRRGKLRHNNVAARLADSIRLSPLQHEQAHAVELLDHLPEKDRELVSLIIWDGFGVAEAGQLLGLRPSTARTRYGRIKEKLRYGRIKEKLRTKHKNAEPVHPQETSKLKNASQSM